MRKVTVSRMRERYAQTVLTFRITYVLRIKKLVILPILMYTNALVKRIVVRCDVQNVMLKNS